MVFKALIEISEEIWSQLNTLLTFQLALALLHLSFVKFTLDTNHKCNFFIIQQFSD